MARRRLVVVPWLKLHVCQHLHWSTHEPQLDASVCVCSHNDWPAKRRCEDVSS